MWPVLIVPTTTETKIKPGRARRRIPPAAKPKSQPDRPQGQPARQDEPKAGSESSRTDARAEREAVVDSFHPRNLRLGNVDFPSLLWIAGVHLGCLAAPFFFSWTGVAAFVVMHWLTCSVGICLGFHRYLAHRSLVLRGPAKFLVLLSGCCAGQGSPLTWSATHRLHHGHSDKDGDPHSPLEGAWWSHILWLFVRRSSQQQEMLYRRYVPDRAADPMVRFFERTWKFWLFGSAIGVYLLGGLPVLLWGVCVRMTVAYHSTWFVNSATHLWGYRNYETTDQSRNLWWVALLSYGEGWHNNHHAYPRTAPAGHRWWEIDTTWWVIRLLRACRLATNVQDRIPAERTG